MSAGTSNDVLILGAGLCGMAAASVLGTRATLLERDSRPGGLVKSDRIGNYWFDRVIHLLHFPDPAIQQRITALLGDLLAPCPPVAFVETAAGTARYPIQHHLHDIEAEAAAACIHDLQAELALDNNPADTALPANYAEFLRRNFGRAFCELFFFPYNRKMWKRPLQDLAPTGFLWNLARPSIDRVQAGLLEPAPVYNANGWYPRPDAAAGLRGMEVLSAALAQRCADLHLNCEVTAIHPQMREVTVRSGKATARCAYEHALLATLPLPTLIQLCDNAPSTLKDACRKLRYNRVRSVQLCIAGPRPPEPGHWRYYTDESLLFTRLVFMTEFDSHMAPADGWSLLAEITESAEQDGPDDATLINRTWADVSRCGILPAGSQLVAADVQCAQPAYVVFEPANEAIVAAARAFLTDLGITPLGRYGHWEYSSMAGVLQDGFSWADAFLRATVGAAGQRS
jgi:protoporphyrinogen oxidase